MNRRTISRKKLVITAAAVCLWLALLVTDFSRVHSFQRPLFCIQPAALSADDGGSGSYLGLGYYFNIKGHFMPEDEFPGVTEYMGYILIVPVMAGVKD